MTKDLYIDESAALAAFASEIADEPIVALDTEFMRERTYYPKLCLAQIATPNHIGCVDCLAEIDLAPLYAVLFDGARTWLMHSARQDLEVLALASRVRAPRLIDTQLAAALVGFAPQIGLADLVRDAIGVELSKGYARTDWTRRPLPDGALRYAFDDVRFLLPLWRELETQLTTLGRLEWLAEDCEAMLEEPLTPDPLVLWGRLASVHALPPEARYRALALIEWRERTAQALDRPRRWILQDATLLNIVKAAPRDLGALAAVPGVSSRLTERGGETLLEALANATTDTALRARVDAVSVPEAPDKTLTKTLQQRVKARASELGIATEVLATRRDIAMLASQGAAGRTRWRAGELAELLC